MKILSILALSFCLSRVAHAQELVNCEQLKEQIQSLRESRDQALENFQNSKSICSDSLERNICIQELRSQYSTLQNALEDAERDYNAYCTSC